MDNVRIDSRINRNLCATTTWSLVLFISACRYGRSCRINSMGNFRVWSRLFRWSSECEKVSKVQGSLLDLFPNLQSIRSSLICLFSIIKSSGWSEVTLDAFLGWYFLWMKDSLSIWPILTSASIWYILNRIDRVHLWGVIDYWSDNNSWFIRITLFWCWFEFLRRCHNSRAWWLFFLLWTISDGYHNWRQWLGGRMWGFFRRHRMNFRLIFVFWWGSNWWIWNYLDIHRTSIWARTLWLRIFWWSNLFNWWTLRSNWLSYLWSYWR